MHVQHDRIPFPATAQNVPALLRTLLLLCTAANALDAQSATGNAVVDSAAAARTAWSNAGRALRASDLALARREIARAASAWPAQPTYSWTRAVLAARAFDTSAVASALGAYADLGVGRDIARGDTALARLASIPQLAAVRARLDAQLAPLVRSRSYATLPDSTFWPEGMDVDPASGRVFVTSIRHRTIAEVTPAGAYRELLTRSLPGVGAMFGVRYDARRNVLWATTSGSPYMNGYQPPDSAIAALLRIRIADGSIEERFDLPPIPGGHVLGDLAIGPQGDVFVTDSKEPVLYRLRAGATVLEPFRSPLFRSLQGIAPAPDGRHVIVADYSHGLLRVELSTGVVTRLADAAGSTSIGCDGIAWDRGGIVAVQNGVLPPRVVRFQLDSAMTRIVRLDVLDRNATVADEPTIGAVYGSTFLYVANAHSDRYGPDGRPLDGAILPRATILAVPLSP